MCTVRTFETGNNFSGKGMHIQLQNDSDLNLITYVCSVHLLNLLAEDLNIPNIKEQTLLIVNFFTNNHVENAKYREAGGNK